ncbi:MAG: hypothetical protein JO353_03890 [Phycisphaerae bacterium]|nr:hypothetical protein [Phycisphaerae bacterium]
MYGDKPGRLMTDLTGLPDALVKYANATGETGKPIKNFQEEETELRGRSRARLVPDHIRYINPK